MPALWGESIRFADTTKVGSLAKVTYKATLPLLTGHPGLLGVKLSTLTVPGIAVPISDAS